MRTSSASFAVVMLVGAAILSCDRQPPLAPRDNVAQPLFDGGAPLGPQVVISQVYGGGGNAGATYKNDFVELFNRGDAAASLAGWSIQYASATGTGNFASPTPLSGTLEPGAYYLVQEAKGAGGTVDLPTPDAVGTIAMAAGAGKVVLVQSTTALACNGGSKPCTAEQLALIVDLVGYGNANFFEGGAAAPTLNNYTAAFRRGGGCAETNNNGADFMAAAPTPRNSTSPTHTCEGGPAVRLVVAPASADVSIGTTQGFTAEAKDADSIVVYPALTWSSLDEAVATVNASGVGTAKALGSTKIVVAAGELADTAVIVVTPPVIRWLDISSSADSFPPGFQTQLFATARTGSGGVVVPATFTFEALDPGVATVTPVANTAIVTGVAASAARPGIKVTATPLDGDTPPYSFTTYSIKIIPGVAADPSIYGTNDEFGDPTAAGSGDPNDLLIVRPQYTLSYNESRGTPNWVSYELDARQFGAQDRCNCFTADPVLPPAKQILTSDYTNGGYDRGHMTRSADRTAANLDNAATFYLTNIVPQTADLNQGPWSDFELALGDSAHAGRAVYVISGPLYSRSHGLSFLKDEGKVAVPDSTWKVAFIGPASGGVPFTRATLHAWGDLPGTTLLAVSMPNVSGIKNVPWTGYVTTVDRIEAATGYDFLSLLPVAFQTALEADDHPPAASFAVSGTPLAGSPMAFDAAASTDPDLGRTDMDGTEALGYAWDFGDGTTATGAAPVKTFTHSGPFTVTLTVTDAWGWPAATATTVVMLTPVQGILDLTEAVASLGGGDGALGSGEMNSLRAKLSTAMAACRRVNAQACAGSLGAFVNELEALVRSGRVDAGAAAPLIDYAERVITSLQY